MKGKREANFELLRIVAMLMIISLHYLDKGGILIELLAVRKETPVSIFAWLIEAFCNVSVNCYVLISGYFCVESAWKPGKIGSLLSQVLFYSMGIPCLFLLFGIEPVKTLGEPVKGLGFYDWLSFALPIEMEHYWFATAFLILYLFAPLLSAGIRQMEKRQLQIVTALLLCVFSLGKSVFPVALAIDRAGYSFGWFLCLFVMGGYIGKYGIPWLEKQSHAVTTYFLSGFCVWLSAMFCYIINRNVFGGEVEAFGDYAHKLYNYNHLLCLVGAVALFYVFKNMHISEGRFADMVRKLAPYTFGVYLLHEHQLIRYEWMQWLGVEEVEESFLFVPHMIGCVLLVYVAGTMVDAVRAWLFKRVRKVLALQKK